MLGWTFFRTLWEKGTKKFFSGEGGGQLPTAPVVAIREDDVLTAYWRIQEWVRNNFGFVPRTCWIAHVKEMSGLEVRIAWNRLDPSERTDPCPSYKVQHIENAFRHFGDIV